MAITVSLVNNKRKIVVLTQPTTVKRKRQGTLYGQRIKRHKLLGVK